MPARKALLAMAWCAPRRSGNRHPVRCAGRRRRAGAWCRCCRTRPADRGRGEPHVEPLARPVADPRLVQHERDRPPFVLGDRVRHRALPRWESSDQPSAALHRHRPAAVTPGKDAATSTARRPTARPRWKACAVSNDDCPMSSTAPMLPTHSDHQGTRRAEITRDRIVPTTPAKRPT